MGNDCSNSISILPCQYFNPRSRVGNDLFASVTKFFATLFQSTFPRGERPVIRVSVSLSTPFQSTFPRGERQFDVSIFLMSTPISIHVPAWGTTLNPFVPGIIPNYFNPRSRVGNDTCYTIICLFCHYFNPRSRVGNDNSRKMYYPQYKISIHVPAWGTTNY